MKPSQINHCQVNKDKARKKLLEHLDYLGFNYKVLDFGIDVLVGDKLMFHGREAEINEWLKELSK